jgi:hypothetical protein
MKAIFQLTLIIIILIGLHCCKYDCPAFPESETIWIPHKKGNILKYYSDSDTIDFEVIENFKSGPSDFKGFLIMDYVFKVQKKTLTSDNRIDWFIKANGKGVIQFHDIMTDKIWTKIID